jgi:hypothetical protein
MTPAAAALPKPLDPRKFRDPEITLAGQERAAVRLGALRTLWFNTGSLCNLTCRNCYIESSPRNDRLVYLSRADVRDYLDEIVERGLATEEIGFTGGEPFMNRDLLGMLADCLEGGFRTLVLTNAMRPMMRVKDELAVLNRRFGERLTVRVSLDHYSQALHEMERGLRSWAPTLAGLAWLSGSGFKVHVAGRTCWNEPLDRLRAGYGRLFATRGIRVDADDPVALTLFPEMDARADVPEITVHCWGILGVSPDAMMCASSRMVVKRKGAAAPVVVPCTLLPYDAQFEMGTRLADAAGPVKLNHPHCAKFCVLGGGSCSRG